MSKTTLSALRTAEHWLVTALVQAPVGFDDSGLKGALAKINRAIEIEKAAKPPRVIILISGGNYQGHASDGDVSLDVLDEDNLEACDPVADPSTKQEYDELMALKREYDAM